MRTKRTLFGGIFLGAMLWAPAALATGESETATTAPATSSALGILALLIAVLALLAAVVLFLALRRADQEHARENAELQRRLRELEAALSRKKDDSGADMQRRILDLERDVDALDAALAAVERAVPKRSAAVPTVPPQPAYSPESAHRPAPVNPSIPNAASPQRAAPVRNAAAFAPRAGAPRSEEDDLLAAMNRVLNGAESPDRAMQRAFPQAELGRMELLHYVRPQRKLQDADYAEFCAYSRINPGIASVMKVGKFVVPYRISLDAPALADWYEIERRSDPENAAPHFVLQRLAVAREAGETVQNEARESKHLLTVERKGRLIACNL